VKIRIQKGGQPFFSVEFEDDFQVEIVGDQGEPLDRKLVISKMGRSSVLLGQSSGPLHLVEVVENAVCIDFGRESCDERPR
jgi:hypothetical protein